MLTSLTFQSKTKKWPCDDFTIKFFEQKNLQIVFKIPSRAYRSHYRKGVHSHLSREQERAMRTTYIYYNRRLHICFIVFPTSVAALDGPRFVRHEWINFDILEHYFPINSIPVTFIIHLLAVFLQNWKRKKRKLKSFIFFRLGKYWEHENLFPLRWS